MDYSYTIEKSRYGLFTSVFANGDKGTTALTAEACDFVTRNIRHTCDAVVNGTDLPLPLVKLKLVANCSFTVRSALKAIILSK